MNKLFALVVLTGCLAVPSFAGDVVDHSLKVAGKDSAKVASRQRRILQKRWHTSAGFSSDRGRREP